MWCPCPAFSPSFIDIVLRISKQPSAGQAASAQQADMLLFSLLRKASRTILFKVTGSLDFLDVCVFSVDYASRVACLSYIICITEWMEESLRDPLVC